MDLRSKEKELNFEDRRKALLDRINKRAVYAKCFGTEAGRKVLLDQIERSYILRSPFNNNNWTTFSLGEQNKVLEIASHIPGIFCECLYKFGQMEEERIQKEIDALMKEMDLKV